MCEWNHRPDASVFVKRFVASVSAKLAAHALTHLSRDEGEVTGKGLALFAHSAEAKWFRLFRQRGTDTVREVGGQGLYVALN